MQVAYAVTYGVAASGPEIVAQLKAWQIPTNNLTAGLLISTADQSADPESIRKVLGHYEDAYNRTDAKALWTIWPDAPTKTRRAIEAYFKSAASIRATLRQGTPEIAANHVEATVSGQLSQKFTPREGNAPPARDDQITFRLKKNDGSWNIVDVQ